MNNRNIKLFVLLLLVIIVVFSIKSREKNHETASRLALDKIEVTEEWTKVSEDIVVFTSDMASANISYIPPHPNATLIVSDNQAVLVDTGFEHSDIEKIRKYLKENNLKLKSIILTHIHPDHTGGLPLLSNNDTKVFTLHPPFGYRTKKDRKPIPGQENMVLLTPQDLEDSYTISLGNKTLKLIHTPGHFFDDHMSVEILEDNILIAGDIILNNTIPNLVYHGDLKSLQETLDKLESKRYTLIIPGHGEIVETKETFRRQNIYLNNAKEILSDIHASGGNISDVKNIKITDLLEDLSYFDNEYNGRKDLEQWNTENLIAIFRHIIDKE